MKINAHTKKVGKKESEKQGAGKKERKEKRKRRKRGAKRGQKSVKTRKERLGGGGFSGVEERGY